MHGCGRRERRIARRVEARQRLHPAASLRRRQAVFTVESLQGPDGALHPAQQALVDHHASQCGFCTPGFVVATTAFLEKHPKPTADDVRHGLSGNLCRCGTYHGIHHAIAQASGQKGVNRG